jgi:hypothetical protein
MSRKCYSEALKVRPGSFYLNHRGYHLPSEDVWWRKRPSGESSRNPADSQIPGTRHTREFSQLHKKRGTTVSVSTHSLEPFHLTPSQETEGILDPPSPHEASSGDIMWNADLSLWAKDSGINKTIILNHQRIVSMCHRQQTQWQFSKSLKLRFTNDLEVERRGSSNVNEQRLT